jgi:transcriptional regulator with XRE-family HTH domain
MEEDPMTETLDAMLTRLRTNKGLSQLQVAEKLCEVSGMATVTRHEVSRWERGERTPSRLWLGWLAQVLDVPVGELEGARVRAKPEPKAASASGKASTPPRRSTTAAGSGSSTVAVSLEYKHRATSVQLKGTYEEPSQAAAVIELFPMMVAPGTNGLHPEEQRRASGVPRSAGGSGATGATGTTPPPAPGLPGAQQRAPAPASAALTASGASRVPMGIRYTKGLGTPPQPANGSTADSTRRARDDR